MKKRWLLIPALLVLGGIAFVWCELHWIIPGWWRGEAFYNGRPTSYWHAELKRWHFQGHWGDVARYYENHVREPSPVEGFARQYFPALMPKQRRSLPPLLNGDPEALPVLRELSETPDLDEMAAEGMKRCQAPGPRVAE